MKQTVPLKMKDVTRLIFRHLADTFGDVGGSWDREIPAPPVGVPFDVTEPIQTCHQVCGLGLNPTNGNSLPVGRYQVVTWEDDRGSHKLYLQDIRNGNRAWCFYGGQDTCMDWRGVQKAA